ncbi:MAG: DNA mismatch repair endonuclease MutL [Myxococcota bacterium]
MGQIQILNEIIANQIAAGEVVERPASIVKELIENALDAGATQIDLHIIEGGIAKLVITDNGCGMAPDDAVLCFSRYATSKLRSMSDFATLNSFGFRGEALASIASVSRMSLTTRQADTVLATKVVVEGGRILEVTEAGAPVGTRIEVESLFYNTPARLKFLKSPRSEASAIETIMRQAALSKPAVGFRLQIDATTKLDVRQAPSEARQFERAIYCLGEDTRGYLYPIDLKTDFLRLSGYVAAPLATRKDSLGLYVYVNGRFVKDKQLVQAIRVAYRTILEIGRHPIGAINIEVDPEVVDVNVHPQKLEVRFSEPSRVQSHLIRLLSDFLSTTPWLNSYRDLTPSPSPESGEGRSWALSPSPLGGEGFRVRLPSPDFGEPKSPSPTSGRGYYVQHGLGGAERYTDLRVVGQIDSTYLLLEGARSMIVLDQHAAHERVVFERVCAQTKQNGVSSQALLFPVSITLSPGDMQTLIEKKDVFLPYGFEIEPFGDHQAIVKTTPAGLKSEYAETIIKDTLSDLRNADRPDALQEFSDHICAQIACHTSIRAGQRLDNSEILALLEQLDVIDYAAHCPHGRPVVRAIPFTEIAQWFHRT